MYLQIKSNSKWLETIKIQIDKVKYLTPVKYSIFISIDTSRLYQKIVLINCIGILSFNNHNHDYIEIPSDSHSIEYFQYIFFFFKWTEIPVSLVPERGATQPVPSGMHSLEYGCQGTQSLRLSITRLQRYTLNWSTFGLCIWPFRQLMSHQCR
jgi:hypothetical protein